MACLRLICVILIQFTASIIGLVYNIDEGLAIGTPIGNVAREAGLSVHEQTHGALKFNLLPHSYVHTKLFSMEENTGELRTAAAIDREDLCGITIPCVLDIVVGVLSKTGNFFQIVPVQINVGDINDNSPMFPQPILKVLIPESALPGMYYNVPTAIDLDIGNNSIQRYELKSDTDLFSLHTSRNSDQTIDIYIVLNGTIDREKSAYYQLHILAMDGGSPAKTGTATINVTVTDINDHKPQFSKESYTVSLPENITIGQTLLQVQATDSDFGQNGLVTYYFGLHTNKDTLRAFSINATSGEIKLKRDLDYETRAQYQFFIGATDHGSQPQTTQTAVVINVDDVNDNTPTLHFNLLSEGDFTVLSEDETPGSFISHLSVADGDAGNNGKVDCEMASPGFQLHRLLANEYKVLLDQNLDRETKDLHKILIRCRDEGKPPLEGTGEVILKVSDYNDNAPVFSPSEYNMELPENNAGDEFIAHVSATDKDVGNNSKILYSLASHFDSFVIDSETGIVKAKAGLDREKAENIVLLVIASDQGEPVLSSTATVYVHLQDVNDMVPKFQETSYQLFVMEEEQPGTFVGKLFAEDKDTGMNGKVKYSLLKIPNTEIPFLLDSNTGYIKTEKTLDRESQVYYTFIIAAKDSGETEQLQSMVNVTVTVMDANDNFPQFSYPTENNNSKIILHTDYVGTLITQVSASDRDRGENASIVFKIISGNPKTLFQIHQTTGEIFVVNKMNEDDVRKHVLTIAASDLGHPSKQQQTKFIIDVHLGNATDIVEAESREDIPVFDNLIIGVTIAVVTILIVLIIIVVIILLKRRSKQQPQYPHAESQQMMAYGDNGFGVTSPQQPISTTVAMPRPGDLYQQVNLSTHDTNSSIPSNAFSTFKGDNSLPSINERSLQLPRACSSVITTNSQSPGKVKTVLTTAPVTSPIYSPPAHPQRSSLRSSTNSIHRWSDNLHAGPYILKQGSDSNRSDNHSELSGEITTSDSGRGGSEEELPHPVKSSPSQDPSHFPHVPTKPKKRVQLVDPALTEEPNIHQRVKRWMAEQDPHSVYYQINVDSEGNYPLPSVTAQTVPSACAVQIKDYTNYMPPSILKNSPRNKSNMTTFSGGRPHERHVPRNSAVMAAPPSAYQANDYYSAASVYQMPPVVDDESDIVTDSVCDEDDGETTTSGSYTINPDDLCNEINDLFFSDYAPTGLKV